MFSRFSFLLSVFCLLGFSGQAVAQDELYAAPPPDDAVFVRFIGFEATVVHWRDLVFTSQETGTLENYFVVHSGAVGIDAGTMLTVVPDQAGSPVEIVEPAKTTGKVALSFLNLGDVAASLKTSDGKVEIVAATDPLNAGFREVNPIAVSVGAFGPDGEIGDPVALTLRRGHPTTIVLSASGETRAVESEIVPGVVE